MSAFYYHIARDSNSYMANHFYTSQSDIGIVRIERSDFWELKFLR